MTQAKPHRARSAALPAFVALLLQACVVTRTTRRNDAGDYTPRPVLELARWRIEGRGRMLGHLLHLEIQDPQGAIRYYRVENARGEWVGHVTEHLQFSRRVPFSEDEEIVGTFTMSEGLGVMLAAGQAVDLTPVALDAVHSRTGSR